LNKGPVSPTTSANPTAEEKDVTVLLRAELQPHENELLAEDGYYQVSSFQLTVNNSQDLCPTGNCEYTLEDGINRPNSISGGYFLEGRLKATVTEGDTKNSKFFLVFGDLEKVGSEETPSKLTEFLEGDIGFGGTIFDPDIKYQVVNGTLEVDGQSSILTLPLA
jgi:hypothetical protein